MNDALMWVAFGIIIAAINFITALAASIGRH